MKKIINYFKDSKNLSKLNFSLILIVIFLNYYIQVFCIPVFWSILVLIFISISIVIYPLFFNNKLISALLSFVNGIGFCVLLYCILFLEQMNFYGLILSIILIGLVTFIPHFLAIQLLFNHLVKKNNKQIKYGFILGILFSIVIAFYVNVQYKESIKTIENFKKTNYQKLDKSYFTERILGMHFIYHTRFCEYDGWRPPKHDPFLNIGMWLNGRGDPLNGINLETRLELYKKYYPNKKYKFKCSCAKIESNNYHSDNIW